MFLLSYLFGFSLLIHPTEPQVVTGWYHTCAVSNGKVWCWGENSKGTLGLEDNLNRGYVPNQMGELLPQVNLGDFYTVALAAGGHHTCALSDTGRIKCWGNNHFGQLGVGDLFLRGNEKGDMGEALSFVDLGKGVRAVQITAGMTHSCALLENGMAKCWGDNFAGQLGIGSRLIQGDKESELGDKLLAVGKGTPRFVQIAAGGNHTCGLSEDGKIKCWGRNDLGQLGLGHVMSVGGIPEQVEQMASVDLGTGIKAIGVRVGLSHTCALLENGMAKCWGSNYNGELGQGDVTPRGGSSNTMGNFLKQIQIGANHKIVQLEVGPHRTCIKREDHLLSCFGKNGLGQLALGHMKSIGTQNQEMGDGLQTAKLGLAVIEVSRGGGEHQCALLVNRGVKCWGSNAYGQLGLGDTRNRGTELNDLNGNLDFVELNF